QVDELLQHYPAALRDREPKPRQLRAFTSNRCRLKICKPLSTIRGEPQTDLAALHSFVRGMRRDLDAVTAEFTMPWNSGPVEGHVNRIKTIKRQMFGRAKPDLLRKRILLSD
uniref:transposase n=1 Tax=Nocardia wallacei TaxID=480035 RepID=UPI0024539F0D